jgi:hypothetical protein
MLPWGGYFHFIPNGVQKEKVQLIEKTYNL